MAFCWYDAGMNIRRFPALARVVLLSADLWLAPTPAALAQPLYDAGSFSGLPEGQGWSYGVVALPAPVEMLTNDSVLLDTTASASTQAGWYESPGPDLNRTNGFSVAFEVLLNAESHVSTNQAGFSVIVLGDDLNGVELGFWTNTIFAQSATPTLFTHGEDTNFTTTAAFVNYAVSISASNYVLSANGTNILSGPLRNYSAFGYPYNQASYLFFGDDTGSAAVSFNVRKVALVSRPILSMPMPGLIVWKGVPSFRNYTVQISPDLNTWYVLGTAGSGGNPFMFGVPNNYPALFVRVTFP